MDKKCSVSCVDYTYDGKGIAKKEGKVIFVNGLIKDEEAEIEIVSEGKNNSVGIVKKILKSSPFRTKPFCSLADSCGGCSLQHMDYSSQLQFKKKYVKDCLTKIAKIDMPVEDCLGMDNPFHYRNKSQVPFSFKNKDICYGFYKENSHSIVQMDECLIQTDVANHILKTIKELMIKYRIQPYEEDKRKGLLRHVLIRKGFSTNQVMVVFVTSSPVFPKRKEFIRGLITCYPNIKTIVQNVNSRDTNVILGEKDFILYGNGYIEDILLGVNFKISSKSFYQVNPKQTELLYSKALELANLQKSERILDAYCGIGTIGLLASKKVSEVIGVEIVKEAIIDARGNAKKNNIHNINFVLDDASAFMIDLAKRKEKIDSVFLDPPRNGCDEKFLESLLALLPNKIIYISCNPSTLARDLVIIKKRYDIHNIQPIDMFPHTYHVETICLLVKKENTHDFVAEIK